MSRLYGVGGVSLRHPRLLRAKDETVAVGVREDRRCAPVRTLGLLHKRNALALQLPYCAFDVVGPEGDVHLATGLHGIGEAEEDDSRLRARDAQLEPALLVVKGLIGDQAEAEFLRVERQRPLLISNWNAAELDASNHDRSPFAGDHFPRMRISLQAYYSDQYYSLMHHVAIDDYVLDVLMPDLTGHDRSPAAFLVYLVLWTRLYRTEERSLPVSLQQFVEATGLSKTAVQRSIRLLKRRKLVVAASASPTAVPRYMLVRHWVKRRRR